MPSGFTPLSVTPSRVELFDATADSILGKEASIETRNAAAGCPRGRRPVRVGFGPPLTTGIAILGAVVHFSEPDPT